MYQNALIADAPSIALSSANNSSIRAHSVGYLPRYTSFNSSSNGICLNAVYPKWMYSPPTIKRRKHKIERDFIKENKWLATHPDLIHDIPPSTNIAADTLDAAKTAYANIMSTMRSREQGSPTRIRYRWNMREKQYPAPGGDQYTMEYDAAERQLLAFADRIAKKSSSIICDSQKDREEGESEYQEDTEGIEENCNGDEKLENYDMHNDKPVYQDENTEPCNQNTFVDELLEDSDFLNEISRAKDKLDNKLNPTPAKPNLAESPFGRPVTIEPTFRYERGTTGEILVLVRPENTQHTCNESKFLYTEEELEKIAATSTYRNYMLRKQADLYNAPYLIPYTFRSSRI